MQVDSVAGSYHVTVPAAANGSREGVPPGVGQVHVGPKSVREATLKEADSTGSGPSERAKKKAHGAEDAFQKVNKRINELVQSFQRHLHFEIHDKTGIMFVRVTDASEGKVLRELPMKEVLDTLARIQEAVGLLMDNKA